MKILAFLVLFSTLTFASVQAQVKFVEGKYRSFQKEAKKTNRNYLVFFYADWCKHCRYLRDNIFPDKEVSATMKKNYMLFGINVDKQKSWGKVYDIKYFPTIILFDSKGYEIRRTTGRLTKQQMLKFLKG